MVACTTGHTVTSPSEESASATCPWTRGDISIWREDGKTAMTTSILIIWKPLSSMAQTNDNCNRIVKKLLFSYTEFEIEGIDFATFLFFY